MSSFAVEHLKANAYNELAELAVATKTKIMRATEPSDVVAILKRYFQDSVAIMRRTGAVCKTANAMQEQQRYGRYDAPRPEHRPHQLPRVTIGEALRNRTA